MPGTSSVAPHAGAWIETLPDILQIVLQVVAPHAGAWIETPREVESYPYRFGRAPRGRVD